MKGSAIKFWVSLIIALALAIAGCGGSPATPAAPRSQASLATRAPLATPTGAAREPAPTDTTAANTTAAPATPDATGTPSQRPGTPDPTDAPPATDTPASEATATPEPTGPPKATAIVAPTDTPATPAPTTGATVALYVSTEECTGVRLRAQPGTTAPIKVVIPYGARVEADAEPVTGEDGADWRRVAYGSESGYVLDELLVERNPLPDEAPPASEEGPEWTLTAVGDIMLSRGVYRKVMAYGGDWRHPFRKTADILRDSDFTVANLELPLSDNQPQSEDPHTFQFVAPSAAAGGLDWAGIDSVSLANNHTMNWGQGPLVDTFGALKNHGVGYFGAGPDKKSAYSPAVYNINGVRVAFLGFENIQNWPWTDPDAPGAATATACAVRDAVLHAGERAEVVIPFFHWGEEYRSIPNDVQKALAQVAIDAGADLVIGAHPHWVQQVGAYKGKLIVYSLGNFVFDQMWSQETRQGAIAKFTFSGAVLQDTEYTPVLIEDYNQPRVATGDDYRAVLDRMGVSGAR